MRSVLLSLVLAASMHAQVYSPRVLLKGQPDASNLTRLTEGIYVQAGARTPRERAEAIWRYFLTDGRFVPPGFWYHIAGWAYEEPMGEVLDPLKLMNSYGFGLCYQIAPVLEAAWRAGGFEDARAWFLTGHTVAEVYYDGAYHHYDSDMMGYTTTGRGPAKQSPVASVHQLENDGSIILSKLKGPRDADASQIDQPWYPADVRAGAMDGLAELFTTKSDNHLFPLERAPQGHSLDFVLRPGERLIRYYHPEQAGLFYLPYKFDGREWKEFPQEIAEYQIRTPDGPRSQKDERTWGTGRLEYHPPVTGASVQVFRVQSPYVIIGAEFEIGASLASERQSVTLETSTDEGRTWVSVGVLKGPHRQLWKTSATVLTRSEHGVRTAVSGRYGYLVRLTKSPGATVSTVFLRTTIQLNPRTLPELKAGRNELVFSSGAARVRTPLAVPAADAGKIAQRATGASYVEARGDKAGQGYWIPSGDRPAAFVFRLASVDGKPPTSFDAGGRFLDLSHGLAPDKFTAEVRPVQPLASEHAAASIAWGLSPDGPFQTIWEYDPKLVWKDGVAIDRTLLWPEVDRHVETGGANEVYLRYSLRGLALDDFRMAVETAGEPGSSPLQITHQWKENGVAKSATRLIPPGTKQLDYAIVTTPGAKIVNDALVFECK
jgi:hypothetical protein